MAQKARKRCGASFTTEEMAVLLDEVEQNQNILFCSSRGNVSNKAKAVVWSNLVIDLSFD